MERRHKCTRQPSQGTRQGPGHTFPSCKRQEKGITAEARTAGQLQKVFHFTSKQAMQTTASINQHSVSKFPKIKNNNSNNKSILGWVIVKKILAGMKFARTRGMEWMHLIFTTLLSNALNLESPFWSSHRGSVVNKPDEDPQGCRFDPWPHSLG